MVDLPLGVYLSSGLRRWVVGEVEGEMAERCAQAIGEWCYDGGARARRSSTAMAWCVVAFLWLGEREVK